MTTGSTVWIGRDGRGRQLARRVPARAARPDRRPPAAADLLDPQLQRLARVADLDVVIQVAERVQRRLARRSRKAHHECPAHGRLGGRRQRAGLGRAAGRPPLDLAQGRHDLAPARGDRRARVGVGRKARLRQPQANLVRLDDVDRHQAAGRQRDRVAAEVVDRQRAARRARRKARRRRRRARRSASPTTVVAKYLRMAAANDRSSTRISRPSKLSDSASAAGSGLGGR